MTHKAFYATLATLIGLVGTVVVVANDFPAETVMLPAALFALGICILINEMQE